MSAADEALSTRDMIARRSRLLGPAYRLFYDQPVQFVRGEGVWLYDTAGDRYLDAYNNVASVGHCHPRVVQAIARQAAVLNTHTRYLHETVLDFAEKLLATFPPEIGHVMFTCTGSEANDLALRVARTCTGGTGFIVTANAYHGVTSALTELSPALGLPLPEGSHVRLVPAPGSTSNAGQIFAGHVSDALADMKKHGIRPAALLVDTIFSSDGVFADPPGFLRPAVEAVRAEGALFIADEVQPGFGRCGEQMWGFVRHGLVPDLVTMGKPMGNGHPVAGMAARPRAAGGVWPPVALLQHLWRQSGFCRRRHCGARRDRGRRADAERATHRWLSNQAAHGGAGTARVDCRSARCRAIRRRRAAARRTDGRACHNGDRADREPAA